VIYEVKRRSLFHELHKPVVPLTAIVIVHIVYINEFNPYDPAKEAAKLQWKKLKPKKSEDKKPEVNGGSYLLYQQRRG
jgi:hypothetical protein